MRVIVTRPEPDARRWVQSLAELGITALALPLIQIRPVSDAGAVHAAWRAADQSQVLMFVSAAAVEHFFAARPQDCGSWAVGSGPRLWATGPGTVAALLRQGLEPARIDAPAEDGGQFDSEALWKIVAVQVRPDWRVLVVRGAEHDVTPSQPTLSARSPDDAKGNGRDWLASQLVQAGAQVRFVVAYWRAAPVAQSVAQVLAEFGVHDDVLWLFTSAQAIANLQAILPSADWTHSRALATHPRIAATARAAGFGVVSESRPALPDIAASIKSIE